MHILDILLEWWKKYGPEDHDGYDNWLGSRIGYDAADDHWAITFGFFCIQDEDPFE